MAKCDYCGSMILFGGVKEKNRRFCNDTCYQHGFLLLVADELPDDAVAQHLAAVHQGDCPKCGGPGPIDVHTSHFVWSALVITSQQSNPEVCCHSCGIQSKLQATLFCGLLGWWGIPWGLIFTPIYLLRNISGLFSWPDPMMPSQELENIVRLNLAAHCVEASQQEMEP